jgi:capsular polysaccharide biosynthesis protein
MDWLRNEVYAVTGCDPAPPFRKLYVTRRNAKVRRVRNEVQVADYLTDWGFEVVALEERPFREQVQLFAEAEVVVAQHGAGLINLLFAQSPCVLEILSDQDRQIYFSLISASRGFAHQQWPMDGTNKNDDVTVPIDQLETRLRELRDARQDTQTGTGSFS